MSAPSESSERSPSLAHDGDDHDRADQPPRKRQRIRLSCLECRRRKLSCDREFPCSRCMQSGTPERCEYETRPGLAPPNKLGLSHSALAGLDARLSLPLAGPEAAYYRRDSTRDHDRIRRLEMEVTQLKSLLVNKHNSLEGSTVHDRSPADGPKAGAQIETDTTLPQYLQYQAAPESDELRFFRGKEFKTRYFGPHSAALALNELTGLCPFMQETAEEWLWPIHKHAKVKNKDRAKGKEERDVKFQQPDLVMEAMLPSKQETDLLVSIYLDQFEQVHRILHIPSFRRQYAKFWAPGETRSAAFTVLVLALLAISSCLDHNGPAKFEGMVSNSHCSAIKWVKACDEWQARQSQKHRRLIHYQIACLVYLAKRVNTMKKKRFWTGSGALIQDAISVGLHREPSHMSSKISPFNQEMRRRIWATMQDYDLQASFDHGLPSLLITLHYDVEPPRNINDDEFDEDSTELPQSHPPTHYTYTSYQHLSRQSLGLRLELSRYMNGPPEDLDYEQVIKYTNEINQEIDALPSWDVGEQQTEHGNLKPLLAYTILHIQLRQYILPLHQPYLKLRKTNSKYQYSEIIYYNATRDMVLLHDKLVSQGVRTLNFLREDNLTLAINLCSVTMLQPRGSTNMIMINSQHTLELLEKCLQMKEDRILRCGNNEPWGYSIVCAALGLLQAHLGIKTSEAAKAASAERFVNLHYKLMAGQDPPATQQGPSSSQQTDMRAVVPTTPLLSTETLASSKPATPLVPPPPILPGGGLEVLGTPWWLPNADASSLAPYQPLNPDFNLETLGLNLNELWAGNPGWDWDAI